MEGLSESLKSIKDAVDNLNDTLAENNPAASLKEIVDAVENLGSEIKPYDNVYELSNIDETLKKLGTNTFITDALEEIRVSLSYIHDELRETQTHGKRIADSLDHLVKLKKEKLL